MESGVQISINCTQTLKPAIVLTGVGLGDVEGAIGRAIVADIAVATSIRTLLV
ncbi:MAG: hypothetical protein KME15_09265 [Drouetiella hepatica Uher 2000/2452]|uniref:Uncharacterized protein n=1 Tax=Drouetiella hepatica Uher 2000/2452 TaxID=904376 RepID=A0A951UM49_9CYAN|nr:hypothetical protein [Drouetiella hepatica Uher 2000/2452]